MASNEQLKNEFLRAYSSGSVCLHPTDTIPGLTFDPFHRDAFKSFVQVKTRPPSKSLLGLVGSIDVALKYWQPLPGHWHSILRTLWPAPLSVVWTASEHCPKSLRNEDNTAGFRMPDLDESYQWFTEILHEIDHPLPTTSVNTSGQPPITDWQQAASFLQDQPNCWATNLDGPLNSTPSTVIALDEHGGFQVLRHGAFDPQNIQQSASNIV